MPDTCPACGGELLRRCKACDAPFSSIAAVDCEECGAALAPGRALRLEDPPRLEALEVFAEERRRDRPGQDLAEADHGDDVVLVTSRL